MADGNPASSSSTLPDEVIVPLEDDTLILPDPKKELSFVKPFKEREGPFIPAPEKLIKIDDIPDELFETDQEKPAKKVKLNSENLPDLFEMASQSFANTLSEDAGFKETFKYCMHWWGQPFIGEIWAEFKRTCPKKGLTALSKTLPWFHPAARQMDEVVHKHNMAGNYFCIEYYPSRYL